jgi:ATP-dependent DNA helicase RecG
MNLPELHQRIERWEDIHTEFKESSAHEDDLSAALVAFANTDGGQLILGVSDERQIKGVGNPDKLMQRLDQIAYHNCEPPLTIVQETVTAEDGAMVVVVNVPKGDQRPYRTNRGDYFIRTTSGRRRASRQELLRLFQSVESLYYDETLVLRASVQDLDTQGFAYFFERAYGRPAPVEKELENTLKNMRLLGEQSGEIHPTLAGLLCFGRAPQRFVYHAQIIAARIPGVSLSAAPSDLKQIEGPLLDMFEDTARFLYLHLPIPHVIKGLEPETRPELPETAVRELLVNAIVHRDYTVHGPIRVLIFDDRIEIRTPGALPNGVTIASILLGSAHILRNPNIYSIFNRAGLVTHLGSGVMRAKELIEQTSHTTIQLDVVGNEFVTTIFRPSRGENL